jgi:hypothetical protein
MVVEHSAFGVRRSAFSVQRSAFDMVSVELRLTVIVVYNHQ